MSTVNAAIMLSSMIPQEFIVENLNKAIKDYELSPDKEIIDEIRNLCVMFLMNYETQGNMEKAKDVAKEIENKENILNLFNLQNN